ncbi:MAG: YitT family protein [Prevotellaceae bacterium]|nr:YitT family protein [Prevotellaceae bacterium]
MNQTLKYIKTYFLITLGLLLYVTGWVVFLIPNEIVGGGVSGIGTIIYYLTGFPIGYTYFIINAILLIMSIRVLGKNFAIKTITATFIVTVLFQLLPEIIPDAKGFGQKFCTDNGPLMCAIMGGIFSGAGIAITFAQGGSTGGTDIVALFVNKYRNVTPGRIILYIDLVIIASSFFVSHDFVKVMYGYILIAVMSSTLDFLLSGSKQSVQMFIFSKKYEEIADRISNELHRGVSVMNSTGWFTKEENKVLLVVVKKYQSNELYRLIKEIDKDAFITVASVMGVFGKGFEQIKVKTKNT